MKKQIIALGLALILSPIAGEAASAELKTDAAVAKYAVQDFRLPGAPSGGYRGDYRFKYRPTRGKRVIRKKSGNRRNRVRRARTRYSDDG